MINTTNNTNQIRNTYTLSQSYSDEQLKLALNRTAFVPQIICSLHVLLTLLSRERNSLSIVMFVGRDSSVGTATR
jgi:hypothetical protein